MPFRKFREGGKVNRRELLARIRQMEQDPDTQGSSENERLVMFVLEQQEAIAKQIFEQMQKSVDDDPRSGYIYSFLQAVWQAVKEFTTVFGTYLEQRKNKKRG